MHRLFRYRVKVVLRHLGITGFDFAKTKFNSLCRRISKKSWITKKRVEQVHDTTIYVFYGSAVAQVFYSPLGILVAVIGVPMVSGWVLLGDCPFTVLERKAKTLDIQLRET